MKNIKYLIFVLLSIFFSCTSGDGESDVLKFSDSADVSDFKMYVGSEAAQKGELQKFEQDTILYLVRTYMSDQYNGTLFSLMTVEFNNDMVTYVDSINSLKILSTYQFKGDSLFAILSNGSSRFIAMGTTDSLYRTKSICRFPSAITGNDSTLSFNDTLNLEKVLALSKYSSLNDMKSTSDTIMWCNVKYRFKKN